MGTKSEFSSLKVRPQFEPRGAGTPLFLHASVSKLSPGHFEFPALCPRATKVPVYWRRACAMCAGAERVVCSPHFQVQLSVELFRLLLEAPKSVFGWRGRGRVGSPVPCKAVRQYFTPELSHAYEFWVLLELKMLKS